MNRLENIRPVDTSGENKDNQDWLHLHEVVKAIHESVQVAEELNEKSSGPHFGIDELTIEFTAEFNVKQEKDAPTNKDVKEKNKKPLATGLASVLRFHKANPNEEDSDMVKEGMLTKIKLRYGKKISVEYENE